MKVIFFTNEYPPNVYGGAGVHVDYLSRELSKYIDVEVHCFGEQQITEKNLSIYGHSNNADINCSNIKFTKAIDAVSRNISMAANLKDADIVHCHTWYSHLSGLIASQLYQVPMVLSTHSFEPSRPWKAEQLGNAYHLSSFIERMAMQESHGIIAVSKGMKADALNYFDIADDKINVIYNGIDLNEYQRVSHTDALDKYGIDREKPYVLFVGRITRQKGIIHLVNAAKHINPNVQIVLCAGAPDTPEIAKEMQAAVDAAKAYHDHIIWIEEMVAKADVIQLYSHATVFCCPSIYEPFGIINLEAMACETPVVGSAVGGIPEIIVPEKTGLLVDFIPVSDSDASPRDPDQFSKDLAVNVNRVLADHDQCRSFAKASRNRVEDIFSWDAIAKTTVQYYEKIIFNYNKQKSQT